MASLSTNSIHIVVENGARYLQFFQPEVVLEGMEKLVSQVRSQQQTPGI